MIPANAKNRDRKCITCRHYQEAPLWRKGWCRNPLLYDRNTNHLVEGESLACNRTFIDYWEPITGPVAKAPAAKERGNNPRIAPSIPMDTTDSQGNRGVTTGNTPASGMAAFVDSLAGKKTRETPKLSIVTPDYDPDKLGPIGDNFDNLARQIQPDAPDDAVARTVAEVGKPLTTAERIKQARKQQKGFFNSTKGRIAVLAAGLVVLIALLGGGFILTRGTEPTKTNQALSLTGTAVPVPTPTGFGDANATPAVTVAPQAPPSGVIGVNGWVKVDANGSLAMREAPAKSGAKLATLPDGTTARVIDGPKEADGYTWWKLDADKIGQGWCAGQFLAPIPAP